MSDFDDTVPSDLDEAVNLLLTVCDRTLLEEYEGPGDFTAAVHHGLGRRLRNDWSLWDNEVAGISAWLKDKGLLHADDKSSVILKAYYCKAVRLPFNLEDEIKRYRTYWADQGVDPDTMEKVK